MAYGDREGNCNPRCQRRLGDFYARNRRSQQSRAHEVLCCDGDGKELVQWTTQGVVHNSPSVIKELAATAQLCSVQVGCTSPLHRRLTSRDSEPLAAQPVYWQGTRKSSKLVSIHVACRAAAEPQPAGRLPR